MRWLRSALLSSTALTGLIAVSAAASAANLLTKAPPNYEAPAAVARWTGCYLGLQAGDGLTRSRINNEFPGRPGRDTPDFSEVGTISADGGVIGGQAGCNYQTGRFVVGVEGELWWSGRTASLALPGTVLLVSSPGGMNGVNLTMRNGWSGALSLRAGAVVNRTLFYGKVGLAATQFDYEGDGITPFQGVVTASTRRSGLLLGFGGEYALTDRWSVRLEYDHIDFGHTSLNFTGSITGPGVLPPGLSSIGVHENMDLVTIGANYRL